MRQVLKKFDRNGILIIAGAVAGKPQDHNAYYRGTIAQLRFLRKIIDESLGPLLEENASQPTERAPSVQVLIPKEAALRNCFDELVGWKNVPDYCISMENHKQIRLG